MTAKNRIIIFGPRDDGTYVVEFRTSDGEALAISVRRSEAHVIRHFQERMPYGLFVPEIRRATRGYDRRARRSRRAGCASGLRDLATFTKLRPPSYDACEKLLTRVGTAEMFWCYRRADARVVGASGIVVAIILAAPGL